MKAVLKKKPEHGVAVENIPIPSVQEDEVLVKVKAVGICGSDVHVYEWTPSYEWMTEYMPIVLGHEYSGEIVEVGSAVKNFKVGDRVIGKPAIECGKCFYCRTNRRQSCIDPNKKTYGLRQSGAFAEYIATLADCCIPLNDLSFEEGALVEPLVVCAAGALSGELKLGDTVVVMGPGPIGLFTMMFAKELGATKAIMIGTSNDKVRFEVARKLGADHIIEADKENPVKAVMELTGGLGANVVFEATGAPSTVQQGLDMLQKMSPLVSLGIHPAPASVNMTSLVRDRKRIIGAYGDTQLWDRVVSWLSNKSVDVSMVISDRVSFDQAESAFEKLLRKEAIKTLFINK